MKYPHVLVLHEKHGDCYYLMNKIDDVFDFSIKLLTERYTSGYYYHEPYPIPSTFDEYFENKFKMSLNKAELLQAEYGDVGVKIDSRRVSDVIETARNDYRRAKEEIKDYQTIVDTVANPNGKKAWSLLQRRMYEGYQYEGFSTEYFENFRG